MITQSTPVKELPGIGDVRAAAFARLGIFTAGDLIRHFPRAYQRRGDVRTVADCQPGDTAAFILTVGGAPKVSMIPGRRRMTITKFPAFDGTGKIEISFFNRPYIAKQFEVGDTFRFWGKLDSYNGRKQLANPICERYTEGVPLPEFVPIYSLSEGLTQKLVAQCIDGIIASYERSADVSEPIPANIREKYDLCGYLKALRAIHFPESYTDIEIGRKYFIFDELLRFSLCMGMSHAPSDLSAPVMEDGAELADMFFMTLPFSPTGAQCRAVADIAADMASGKRMDRLLCGDVGSGKTLCAEAAAYVAAKNGYQTAFLAPTEVLARQHYKNVSSLLEPLGVRCAVLTGSTKAAEKKKIYAALSAGEIDVCVGTHALLSEGVNFSRLGLAVTDEQHRFGVRQRSQLASGSVDGKEPHILVMSATPIPRTLAILMYGDLSSSMLDELPPGRQKIDTFAVTGGYHERLLGFIRKLTSEGRQCYVICPAVGDIEKELTEDDRVGGSIYDPASNEDVDTDDAPPLKSAVEYGKQLADELPELRIGILHGRMKPKDKDAVMQSFADGEINVLVSTTVIEVGIDVPNATLMIIENAERFGLSQLHQLRGRVGRGQHKSYCVLVSDSKSETARKRLDIMKTTDNGFVIAQTDLELRGPGDFFPSRDGGARQHGELDMGLASLGADVTTLEQANEAARQLLKDDPMLTKPENAEIGKAVREAMRGAQNAMN